MQRLLKTGCGAVLFWSLLWLTFSADAESLHDTAVALIPQTKQRTQQQADLPELILNASEHFSDIETANLDGLLARIGDSRLVLLGESSHGSAEFYDMRARISRDLITKKGFNIIAVEADWPDAASIDYFIRGIGKKPVLKIKPFSGYPSWMWANHSMLRFTQWLKKHNAHAAAPEEMTAFFGLDLYNLFASIETVVDYLQAVDPNAADAARWFYSCLKPWANDPSLYSGVMQSGRHCGCEAEVSMVYQDLLNKRALYVSPDNEEDEQNFFHAEQNARLAVNGERYFRTLYNSNNTSWNQRDQNMFDSLLAILDYWGASAKVIIWAHNSHIGDARATDMSDRGDFNLGQLLREAFGNSTYLVGFGTDHGIVAASADWGEAVQLMQIPPSHQDSYGYLFHQLEVKNFLLPLRASMNDEIRKALLPPRLQRAIGTAYDPKHELKKHYSHASLPQQFDEFIWFDETHAVKPLVK